MDSARSASLLDHFGYHHLHFTIIHAKFRVMPRTRYGVWEELRVIRERTGYTSADLSKESGILPSYLSELENGKRWPNSKITKQLAVALNVPYTVLERPADQKIAAA